jgi:hypothetical protein
VVGEKLGNILYYFNQVPDQGNYEVQYQRALRDLTRAAQKAGKTTPKDMELILDRAKIEADRNSFRDENFVSNSLGAFKKGLNTLSSPITGTDSFGLGDFVMKYTKTPANLLKRGFEYSPLGLIEAAYYAGKVARGGDSYARRQAIQSISKVITGTGSGAIAGAMMAAMGILVQPQKDDYTSEGLERERGVRDYSINLSALVRLMGSMGGGLSLKDATKLQDKDMLVPIGWAQPWALQASVGAAVYNKQSVGKAAFNSLTSVLEVMNDQSVTRSLSDYLRAFGRGRGFADAVEEVTKKFVKDAPQSFVPGVTRQIGKVVDPYMRDFRPEDREGITAAAKEGGMRALAGLIPGLSRDLPTRTSPVTGEEKRHAVGELGTTGKLLSLIAPVLVNRFKDEPLANEIIRLNALMDEKDLNLYVRPLGERETKIENYREPTTQLRGRENAFAREVATKGRRLVQSRAYIFAKDEEKAEMLRGLVGTERKATVESVRPALSRQAARQPARKPTGSNQF